MTCQEKGFMNVASGDIRAGDAVRVRYDTVRGVLEFDTVVEGIVPLGTVRGRSYGILVRTEDGRTVSVSPDRIVKVYR